MVQRVYVAFEGGGAKGIAHVGALRAFERAVTAQEIEIAGYAGTSAGAIVAALAAAGWTADELCNPAAKSNLLDTVIGEGRRPVTAIELLGGPGWRAIRQFQLLLKARGVRHWKLFIAAAALWFLLGLPLLAWALIAWQVGWGLVIYLCISLVYTAALVHFSQIRPGLLLRLGTLSGLARLDQMETALQKALAHKLRPGAPDDDRPVTFRELAAAGVPPLRIVSSDLRARGLRLFPSSEADLDLPVARAVAASACLPAIFSPVRFARDGAEHLDGGMVSNLPAWAFNDELRIEDTSTILAVKIVEKRAPSKPEKRSWRDETPPEPSLLARLGQTVLFGSGSLNTQGIAQLEEAELEVPFTTLQFDIGYKAIQPVLDEAERAAHGSLIKPLTRHEAAFTTFAEELRKTVAASFALLGNQPDAPLQGLRCSILLPFGAPTSGLRVRYASGYETSPDDRMSLPITGSVCGEAFRGPQTLLVYDMDDLPDHLRLKGRHYQVLRNRNISAPKAFIAAFRFDVPAELVTNTTRLRPSYVVQIDGPRPLKSFEIDPEDARQELERISRYLGEGLILKLGDLPDDPSTIS